MYVYLYIYMRVRAYIYILEGRYLKHSKNLLLLTNSVFEYYYFFNYLLKIFPFSILTLNSPFLKKLIKINRSIIIYLKNNLNRKSYFSKDYLNVKFSYKIEYHTTGLNLNSVVKPISKIIYSQLTYFKLFNLFFLFNYSVFNLNFKFNFKLNFFLVKEFKKGIILININKFFSRWIDSYNIFYNIFYYNFSSLTFGSFQMKNEVLAINWYYSKFEISLWQYYFPFFVFKLNSYNKQSDFFFHKIHSFGINFFFVIDSIYHYKNLYYFKKHGYYSIGLIGANLDPSLLSYPILNFFNSYIIQAFFFRLIFLIQKSVYFKKFCYFKGLWSQLYLKNFFSSLN